MQTAGFLCGSGRAPFFRKGSLPRTLLKESGTPVPGSRFPSADRQLVPAGFWEHRLSLKGSLPRFLPQRKRENPRSRFPSADRQLAPAGFWEHRLPLGAGLFFKKVLCPAFFLKESGKTPVSGSRFLSPDRQLAPAGFREHRLPLGAGLFFKKVLYPAHFSKKAGPSLRPVFQLTSPKISGRGAGGVSVRVTAPRKRATASAGSRLVYRVAIGSPRRTCSPVLRCRYSPAA